MDPEDLVTVGVIVKPHGIRGAVKVIPLIDDLRELLKLKKVFLTSPDLQATPTEIIRAQPFKKWVILYLWGVQDRDQADRLRGYEIQIPRAECPELPPDHYYVFDVVGLSVWTTDRNFVGKVEDIYEFPASHVLVVRKEQKEVLIPAVKQFVKRVDLSKGEVIIEPIEGLLD